MFLISSISLLWKICIRVNIALGKNLLFRKMEAMYPRPKKPHIANQNQTRALFADRVYKNSRGLDIWTKFHEQQNKPGKSTLYTQYAYHCI